MGCNDHAGCPGCACTPTFTCRHCLRNTKPAFYTSDRGLEYPSCPVDLMPAPVSSRGSEW